MGGRRAPSGPVASARLGSRSAVPRRWPARHGQGGPAAPPSGTTAAQRGVAGEAQARRELPGHCWARAGQRLPKGGVGPGKALARPQAGQMEVVSDNAYTYSAAAPASRGNKFYECPGALSARTSTVSGRHHRVACAVPACWSRDRVHGTGEAPDGPPAPRPPAPAVAAPPRCGPAAGRADTLFTLSAPLAARPPPHKGGHRSSTPCLHCTSSRTARCDQQVFISTMHAAPLCKSE